MKPQNRLCDRIKIEVYIHTILKINPPDHASPFSAAIGEFLKGRLLFTSQSSKITHIFDANVIICMLLLKQVGFW